MVIGVNVNADPFQDTMLLEVVELSVLMNCDPSHCSQANVNGVLVVAGEKPRLKITSLVSAGLKLMVDSVAPSVVEAAVSKVVSPKSV